MSYRPASFGLLAATSLAGVFFAAIPVAAADLDPGYADIPPAQQVTFGSGWYIRGDIGATRLPSIKIGNPGYPTKTDLTIPDAPTETISNGSRLGYVASLGAGYQINNWFRTDVIADFNQSVSASSSGGNGQIFCPTGVSYPYETISSSGATNYGAPNYASGGCTGQYRANLSSYDVLVNGYVDLGNWNSITPYVGAGVGLSFGHYSTSATYYQSNNVPYQVSYDDPQFGTFSQNYDRTSSGNYYNLAWAFMGGFAIDVFSHTKLDIGYRYVNLGAIPGASNKMTTQQVRAGLRYMIDN